MAPQQIRKFSAAEDQNLVASVVKYPILYNHEGFTSRNVQQMREGWRAVAAEVAISETYCKRRWRDIRDHYFKIKRREEITKTPANTKWIIYDKLSFLGQGVRLYKRRTRSHLMDQQDNYPSTEHMFDMYEPETTFKIEAGPQDDFYSQLEYVNVDVMVPPHMEADTSCLESSRDASEDECLGRKSTEAAGSRADAEDEDDVDVFMKSIALSVKKLPPKLRADAKLKILALVTELEFPSG